MTIKEMKKIICDANGWYGISDSDVINFIGCTTMQEEYSPCAACAENAGVKKGTVTAADAVSEIYPGSKHHYSVYVPADYDAQQEYPLTIFLDGSLYMAPPVSACNVLDNLIAQKKIPAMIAVFLDAGDNGDGMPLYGGAFYGTQSNRSREYDSTDDLFARFLDEELLPLALSELNVSADPEKRCIIGMSSAGNAAFNVVWHHTHSFRKCITHVGSFVDIRGGHEMPSRIRRSPKKPIRIWLQDGENDLNIVYGDWRLGAKAMASALEYRGYDYRFTFGSGAHSFMHASAIIDEQLIWMWRDC